MPKTIITLLTMAYSIASFIFFVTIPSSATFSQDKKDRIVVLTFDDSAKTHFSTVRPILLKYGFGATFFITEGWDFASNKRDYMTWDEIAQLHRDGFEIGNHTRDHMGINDKNLDRIEEQLQAIDDRCKEHGIPKPVSFAWPGNATTTKAFDILAKHGIRFARRGGAPERSYESGAGFAYEPGKDHPLLLPSAGDAKPKWEIADFISAAKQAQNNRIAILQFHGVPDTAHDWVSTASEKFEAYMHYLAVEKYRVVALKDLLKLVQPAELPKDPMQIVRARQQAPAHGPRIFWIDVEGGAATLIVSPDGESVLIDSGNPGYRDADRIAKIATQEAGLKRIDHLITTHYHRDHFGGASTLAKLLPIGTVWDNGAFEGQREKADPDYYEFQASDRRTISAGDSIELRNGKGMPTLSLRCLGARQKFVPVDATVSENKVCQSSPQRPVDNSDNANSVVMLLRFGDFEFLNTGDLTWNSEFDLVCPQNRVGKVDVFQASHHGLDQSNNPVLIKSIEPRVAIINNGTKKGCMPMMFSTLKETPSIAAVYQMHKNLRDDGSVNNVPDEFIANQTVDCKAEHIRLSVAADGKTFVVSVPATSHEKQYSSVP